jgi:hypothetical protein
MTAKTNSGNGEKQIPFGDDNQRNNDNEEATTTKRQRHDEKYRGLSTARRTVIPSVASVEMTDFFRNVLLIPGPCTWVVHNRKR